MSSTCASVRCGQLLVAFALTLVGACGSCDAPDADEEEFVDENREPWDAACPDRGCFRNLDCSGGSICTGVDPLVEEEPGCCVQVTCQVDDDCENGERCVPDVGVCQRPLDCVPGTTCTGGGVCIEVENTFMCVDETTLVGAAACHLEPPRVVVGTAGAAHFSVLGEDASGAPLFTTSATFTSDLGTVVSDGRDASFIASTCTAPPCRGTVTASTGGASCTADVVVLGALAPDTLRVSVANLMSRAPLVGVDVVVRRTDANDFVTAVTDADGVVVIDALPFDLVEAISVFPDDHGWLTVLAPGTADASLFVEPFAPANASAVKGDVDFSDGPVFSVGEFAFAYVGIAPRVPLMDVDFRRFFGPLAARQFDIDGVTNGPFEAHFPTGQTLAIESEPLKPRFLALGRAFENTLFSFAGKMRSVDVGPYLSAFVGEPDPDDDGFFTDRFVTRAMRLFSHQVAGDVVPAPVTVPDNLLTSIFDDQTLAAPDVTLRPAMPNHAIVDVFVPRLPCHSVGVTDCATSVRKRGALVLATARVPGRGLIPLGMHAAVDDEDESGDFDGRIGDVVTLADGEVADLGRLTLFARPPYGGLEGLPLTYAVVARNDGVLFAKDDAAMSVLLQTTTTFERTVGFSSEGFLPTPSGAIDDDGNVALNVSPDVRSELIRMRLADASGAMWDIVMPSARPIVLADLRPDDVTGRDGHGHIVAARLNGAPDAPTSFTTLVERTGQDLDRIDAFVQAWARAPLAP